MCLLCSRIVPITLNKCTYYALEMSLSRSKNVHNMLKKYVCYVQNCVYYARGMGYYAQEMCLLCSRNVHIMLKKYAYYAQEIGLL